MIFKKVFVVGTIVFTVAVALAILAGWFFVAGRRPLPSVIQCPSDPRCPPIIVRETSPEQPIPPPVEVPDAPKLPDPQPASSPLPEPSTPSLTEPSTPQPPVYTPPPEPPGLGFASPQELSEFRVWAQERGILLQGIQVDINHLFDNQYDRETDTIELEKVPGVAEAYRGLKRIPDPVLEVMRDKTVYLSTISERPFAFTHGEYGGVLKGLTAGIVVTQTISAQASVHELGHILGYNGIEGIYDSNYPQFKVFREDYDRIFNTGGMEYVPDDPEAPQGYISRYATANQAENFAEHFAYYVTAAEEFRHKLNGDSLLVEKYNFFKTKIFEGKEY